MERVNAPLVISSFLAFGLHLVLIAALAFTPEPTIKPKNRLVVRTIKLTTEKPKEKQNNSPPAKVTGQNKEALQKKIAKPTLKKEPIKTETPPSSSKPSKKEPIKTETPPSSSKPSKKESTQPSLSKDLLAKARESLNKIEATPSAAISAALPTPELLSMEMTEATPEIELAYRDELSQLLQAFLRLPEMGDINLKLTITKNGSIKKLEILSSESSANRNYIEKTLPHHTMPPLGKQFGNVDSYTFSITMKGLQT